MINSLLQDQSLFCFPLDALTQLPDALIVEKLTKIKGIGPWTAEIYLLFCLERLSIFPASDLAIQLSYQKLKSLDHRPTRPELMTLTQNLAPYRGAAAHLLWHYYQYHIKQKVRQRLLDYDLAF
jgi:DNA-3-methyladenine glycosylase II